MNLKPLYDCVIVKRLEAETRTASGLIIPDTATEKPSQGVVLAVGPGKANDRGDVQALQVKANDQVLFGKYGGSEIKVNGETLLLLRENEIFAIIEA
jgi:chaperonin GroES